MAKYEETPSVGFPPLPPGFHLQPNYHPEYPAPQGFHLAPDDKQQPSITIATEIHKPCFCECCGVCVKPQCLKIWGCVDVCLGILWILSAFANAGLGILGNWRKMVRDDICWQGWVLTMATCSPKYYILINPRKPPPHTHIIIFYRWYQIWLLF